MWLNERPLLHYQIGAFNGEGINQKDKDNRKDIIGGVWVMPVKGLRIGAFGWTGSQNVTNKEEVNVRMQKNRYALSGEYAQDDWTIRSEYIHSQGWNLAHTSDKADGYYALFIAPIKKNKLHIKGRYDLYREAKEWGQSKTQYEIGADYMFTKNLQLNVEYARVNDRTIKNADKHNYNMVDVELDFRF
jgi:predicted porin